MKVLSLEEFNHFRDSGEAFSLVNVLPEADFEKTYIPGSINVPVEGADFIARVSNAVGDRRDSPIVTYCMSEECPASTQAAEQLEAAGFADVYDFKGGWESWNSASRKQRNPRGSRRAPRAAANGE